MRQMACHPDLVLRSKTNAGTFLRDETGEATVCRICNDFAEDAIQARCRHIFDRECIKQYLNTAIESNVCTLSVSNSSNFFSFSSDEYSRLAQFVICHSRSTLKLLRLSLNKRSKFVRVSSVDLISISGGLRQRSKLSLRN